MKKALILLAMSATPLIGWAQLVFGIKGTIPSLGFEWFKGAFDFHERKSYAPSFIGGVYARYPLGEQWGVQAEALYSCDGMKYESSWRTDTRTTGSIKTKYLEIPLLIRYEGFGLFHWFVQCGPSLRMQTGKAWHDYTHHVNPRGDFGQPRPKGTITYHKDEVGKAFNKSVLALNVGSGFVWEIRYHFELTGELRIAWDISDATSDISINDDWHAQNARLIRLIPTIGAGYKF